MRSSRGRVARTLLLLTLTTTSASFAEEAAAEARESGPSTQDRALAEALFREGKQLGEEGRIPEACQKFKESQRLDPTVGTQLHLAACYEEEGKTASAWAAFNAAADLAGRARQPDREALSRQRAAELEGQLSRVVINVVEKAEGMQITLDDTVLGEGTWGTLLPVDPGAHVLTVSAPGKKTWAHDFRIEKGPATANVDVPTLEDEALEAPPPPVAAPPAPPSPRREQGPPPLVGFVVGGVGVAAIGVGSFFGLRAASQADDADRHCQGKLCTQRGLDGHEDARTSALISNIFFGAGVVGVAAGTYLVLSAGSPSASQPRSALYVGVGAGSVTAGSTF